MPVISQRTTVARGETGEEMIWGRKGGEEPTVRRQTLCIELAYDDGPKMLFDHRRWKDVSGHYVAGYHS